MKIPDLYLTIPSLFLSIFGLIGIYSISNSYFHTQLTYIIIGFIIFFIISQFDFTIIFTFTPWYLIISILLLLITLIFGKITRGSSRWINIGNLRFQTSEFIKPVMILGLSYFSKFLNTKKFYHLLSILFLIMIPTSLILFQPDLGSSMIILIISSYILLAMGFRKRFIFVLIIILTTLMPIAWNNLENYQKQRVQSFINPNLDPLGSSYNQVQSIIAVGSGRFFGKGLGKGTQSQLHFLPEKHTDFFFASISEEWGFVGVILIFFLYLIIFLRLLYLANIIQIKSHKLVFIGIFILFFSQFSIHIAINIGLLPVTGLTLPLMSVGGSSVISSYIALGLASSLGKRAKYNKSIFLR